LIEPDASSGAVVSRVSRVASRMCDLVKRHCPTSAGERSGSNRRYGSLVRGEAVRCGGQQLSAISPNETAPSRGSIHSPDAISAAIESKNCSASLELSNVPGAARDEVVRMGTAMENCLGRNGSLTCTSSRSGRPGSNRHGQLGRSWLTVADGCWHHNHRSISPAWLAAVFPLAAGVSGFWGVHEGARSSGDGLWPDLLCFTIRALHQAVRRTSGVVDCCFALPADTYPSNPQTADDVVDAPRARSMNLVPPRSEGRDGRVSDPQRTRRSSNDG
jgi:hypothetical protein